MSPDNDTKCHVLIPSAGSGLRFGTEQPKQFQSLGGIPVISHCVDAFLGVPEISSIWVGLSETQHIPFKNSDAKVQLRFTGGSTRAQTVLKTLEQMLKEGISANDWALVHDAARPGIESSLIQTLIREVTKSECVGGILALPVADTLKQSEGLGSTQIARTVSRVDFWQAQTPQMFRIGQLRDAIQYCFKESIEITDEASAIEHTGLQPLLVKGSIENFKITYPQDLQTMEKLMNKSPNLRIGQGYDVHRLVPNRDLVLGGIKIPSEVGLDGHSDADALLHAITDALIGAAGLGDIGRHFPDTDQSFKDADSGVLLQKTYALVQSKGFSIVNIDSTIICQTPKLAKWIPSMVERISKLLVIAPYLVNIKAKTNEGLGYLGAAEAIETQAVVLLKQ
jgi:2-C-methyl-D-erythritol 4-phosphate cytidylyltransferase / 2-C-methyl-D-erythritol 2,4-cyclodiphosphate synthase